MSSATTKAGGKYGDSDIIMRCAVCVHRICLQNSITPKITISMKAKNVLFAVLVASAVNVSMNEIDEAYSAFVNDLKAEEGRV